MLEAHHQTRSSILLLVAKRFQILRALHRSDTFHARDGRRHVAIVVVPAADHDVGAFRRSIANAAALDHPNLCRMRELVELDDQLVVVSQLVEGVSVADRLMIGPFDPLQVGVLIGELLSALACAHHAGIAHGRVSPSTVIIDDTGKLRLMDLGVQYRGASMRGDLSAAGTLASTMLSGSDAAVPPQLASWIERSASFSDADTALAALLGQTAVKRIVIPAKVEGAAKPKPAPTRTLLGVPVEDRPSASPAASTSDPSPSSAATSTALAGIPAAAVAKTLVDGSAATATTTAGTVVDGPAVSTAKPAGEDTASTTAETKPVVGAASIATTAAATGSGAPAKTEPTPGASIASPATIASLDDADAVATLDEIAADAPTGETRDKQSEDTPPARTRGSRFLIAGGVAAAAIVALALWMPASPSRTGDPATPPAISSAPTVRSAPGDLPPLPTGAVQPPEPDPVVTPTEASTSPPPTAPTGSAQPVPPAHDPAATPTPPPPLAQPTTPRTPAAVTPPASAARPIARPASRVAGETIAQVPFSPESAWIEKSAVYVLEDVYRQLVRDPLARIEISGHTSSDGDGGKNYQLAMGRAYSTKNYLVQRGIEEARIEVVLRPDQTPIASNDTVEGRAKNRRADVRLISAPQP